jgi:hypothetical protein
MLLRTSVKEHGRFAFRPLTKVEFVAELPHKEMRLVSIGDRALLVTAKRPLGQLCWRKVVNSNARLSQRSRHARLLHAFSRSRRGAISPVMLFGLTVAATSLVSPRRSGHGACALARAPSLERLLHATCQAGEGGRVSRLMTVLHPATSTSEGPALDRPPAALRLRLFHQRGPIPEASRLRYIELFRLPRQSR